MITTTLCAIALFSNAAIAQSFDETEDLDGIVAIVNENIIVRTQLDHRVAQITAKLDQSGSSPPPRRVIERQVLNHLITQELQLQEAEKAGIGVDNQTLAKAIGNIARGNNLTISELREALEADGMSFAKFREQMRNEIIVSRLQTQEVRNRISVTDQELKNYFASGTTLSTDRTEFQVLHILLATPEAASSEDIQEAKEKADRLALELRSGADFRQIAMMESDGRNALEGGDLGWLTTKELPTLLRDLVHTMDKGEISDPIRTTGGYHIFKLADYKGGERLVVNQTRARHILIKPNEIVTEKDARIRLGQLRERILQGEDFGILARSHSDDKASAIKGGDLDWVSPGDLVPRFEEEMNKLPVGEISPPFQSQFGWHIVQVLERRDHDSTEEIRKAEARDVIRQRKAEEATDLWLRRLRDEAYVEIRLDS